MNILMALYWIACYTLGLASLLLGVGNWLRTEDDREGAFVTVMLSFTALVVPSTLLVYLVETGKAGAAVRNVIELVMMSATISMYYTVPHFANVLSLSRWRFSFDRIVLAATLAAWACFMVAYFSPWRGPAYVAAFSLLGLAIAYTAGTGAISTASHRKKGAPGPRDKWLDITSRLSIAALMALPLFFLIDFLQIPAIKRFLPRSFRVYPGFYALWNILYIWASLSRRHALALPSEPARDLSVPDLIKTSDIEPERFGLSPRETEVACHLLSGLSYQDIADRLHLSLATVKTHVNRCYQKTGASSKIELLRMVSRPAAAENQPKG